MNVLVRLLVALYLMAGAVALLRIPASAHGWFGLPQDAWAGVYAIVLALPWSVLLNWLPEPIPTGVFMVVLAVGMALNALIFVRAWRWLRRWRTSS